MSKEEGEKAMEDYLNKIPKEVLEEARKCFHKEVKHCEDLEFTGAEHTVESLRKKYER